MRIERICCRNFRAYRGVVDLRLPASPDPSRPVYLIGGENGAGKTSLLMALGYALYGADAEGLSYHAGRRDRLIAYRSSIEECLNRDAARAGEDSMAVTIQLDAYGDAYEIHREWWFEDFHLTDEDVRIRVNGRPIAGTPHDVATFEGRSDAVVQLMETLLPARAARFFCFDGEEVASIAERDLGRSVIKGLDDLLGLDIVQRLVTELGRIQRGEREKLRAQGGASELEDAQRELSDAEECYSTASRVLADARTAEVEAEEQLEAVRAELTALFEGRKVDGVLQLERELGSDVAEFDLVTRDLNRSLAESLALTASRDLVLRLSRMASSALQQRQHREIQIGVSTMGSELFRRILASATKPPLSAKQRAQLEAVMDEEVNQLREALEGEDPILAPLANADLVRLQARASSVVDDDVLIRVRQLALRRYALRRRIDTLRRDLRRFEESSLPSDLLEKKDKSEGDLVRLRAVVDAADQEAAVAEERRKHANRRLTEIEDGLAALQLSAAKASVARHARLGFEHFIRELRARRAFELEGQVSKMLRLLLHREGALDRVAIDAHSNSVRLFDARGGEIPVPSAGEKEIFALSLIHGLGILAHRDSPIVIDTPLGRLDRSHRRAIVTTFLPTASHQVIVLATDSEIDGELYEALRGAVAWQGTLRAMPDGGVSIESGRYFDEVAEG